MSEQWAVGSGQCVARRRRLRRHAAMPSDVRWRLCPTVAFARIKRGYAPESGAQPRPNSEWLGRSESFRRSGGGAAIKRLTKHVMSCAILLLTAHCTLHTVMAQGFPQPSSPLYGARSQDTSTPSGLPKALREVGIDQHLNEQLPLDLSFQDEHGQTVKLGQYFGKKPVVLALVYYNCPMLCTQILNGMVGAFKVMSFTPGTEFEVVTVSFDPRESSALA